MGKETTNLSKEELEMILKYMDVVKGEYGPFPPSDNFYKLKNKIKLIIDELQLKMDKK